MLRIFALKTSSCGCGGSVPVVKRKQLTLTKAPSKSKKRPPASKKRVTKTSKKGSTKAKPSKK